MAFDIRRVTAEDDVNEVTELVHSAYAPHLVNGLHFWGTRQTPEETARRIGSGVAFVAMEDGCYIGIIIARPPQPSSVVKLYRDPTVWSFGQLSVAPGHKGLGLGRQLHEAALAYARSQGAKFMALDTAQPATQLIELYRRWGYEAVGTHDWRPRTNYLSVLMMRPIDAQIAYPA
jgi:GNAT superfamily N-acetyltransferase